MPKGYSARKIKKMDLERIMLKTISVLQMMLKNNKTDGRMGGYLRMNK